MPATGGPPASHPGQRPIRTRVTWSSPAAPAPDLSTTWAVPSTDSGREDLFTQRVTGSALLPVGVVTGVGGGAYLAWLLRAERRADRV
ncbi:hypothetical protein GCM10022232_37590 [Streptomyces plumbiresistens]|uniref:Uncharacterized protein n=1 Tax=Streptomyces plumbiresistens TaxID=511811 RepID=A0ABP7RGE4_9ACTN